MNQINQSILRATLLVGVAVAAAASYVAAKGLHWTPAQSGMGGWRQVQAKQKAVRTQNGIDLTEFQSLLSRGAIVVDARPRAEFERGHLLIDTVPPVLNVPSDAADATQINRLMHAQQQTGFPLVVYCSSRACDYADALYRILEPYGFLEVKILLDGWEGIQRASLPTATGPDTWTGFATSSETERGDGGDRPDDLGTAGPYGGGQMNIVAIIMGLWALATLLLVVALAWAAGKSPPILRRLRSAEERVWRGAETTREPDATPGAMVARLLYDPYSIHQSKPWLAARCVRGAHGRRRSLRPYRSGQAHGH